MNLFWLMLMVQAQIGSASVGLQAPVASVQLAEHTPLFALSGLTLNVYFQNVVRYEGVFSDLTNIVTCAKGSYDATKWTYSPTDGDAGTNTFALTVKNRASGLVLTSKTVSLVTRPSAYPAIPVSRKFLLVGDSTTTPGTVSAELFRLCLGDGDLSVTQVGSNTGDALDSTATSRSVAFDGFSGTDYAYASTNLDHAWTTLGGSPRVGSAFVIPVPGEFDFNYWLTNYSISMTAGDWVVWNLGINTMTTSSDAQLSVNIAGQLNALTNIISKTQLAVPGVRIGIAITIPPNQDINAFIADYGAGSTWIYRYVRNHQLWVQRLLALLDGTMANVYLVPIHANLDCVNDFSGSGGAVHPSASGYYKIAQSFRMFLKGNE